MIRISFYAAGSAVLIEISPISPGIFRSVTDIPSVFPCPGMIDCTISSRCQHSGKSPTTRLLQQQRRIKRTAATTPPQQAFQDTLLQRLTFGKRNRNLMHYQKSYKASYHLARSSACVRTSPISMEVVMGCHACAPSIARRATLSASLASFVYNLRVPRYRRRSKRRFMECVRRRLEQQWPLTARSPCQLLLQAAIPLRLNLVRFCQR